MNFSKLTFRVLLIAGLSVLTGCLSTYAEDQNSTEYQPVSPIAPSAIQKSLYPSGAIYDSAQDGLFATDRRANRIGDILTVFFVENFQATKSQNAANNKATGFELNLPGFLGMDKLEGALSTGVDQSFSGSGSAAQSNSLTGQMSVTVARVFEGGNLEILGQKKLTLNNGDEYIRVQGIVRPEDISSNNVISSDRIANAKIIYIGAGDMADTAKVGWLQRILTNVSPY